MITIKDIAKKSGYSIGTVSRVINNHPDVSEKARDTINAIIEKEKFKPNRNAQFLKQTKQGSITLFVKGMGNVFLEALLEKIQNELKKSGEEADVLFVDESTNEITLAEKIERDNHPKGMMFLGGGYDNFLKGFGSIHVPSVLVSQSGEGLPFDNLSSFYVDDYEAAYELTEIMLSKGHKKIGILCGHLSVDKNGKVIGRRLKGTYDCFKDHNIKFDVKNQVIQCRFDMKDAYMATSRLLKKSPDISLIFAHSDVMAIGVMRALSDMNKRIPEDISVVGFDGIELTQFLKPRLTTVRQDSEVLSELAVYDLLYRIKYPNKKGKHQPVPFQIIQDESMGNHKEKNHVSKK